MHERRKHDDDVSGQLKLLRQAVLEVQKLNHNKMQSTMSMINLHRTIVEEGEHQQAKKTKKKKRAKEPGAQYRGEEAPSLIQPTVIEESEIIVAPIDANPQVHIEERSARAPLTPTDRQEHNDLSDLPPRIRDLLLKPQYKSLLLDGTHLSYKESKDAPSGAFGVIHEGTYLGQPIVVKKLLMKNPTNSAMKEILDEAELMKRYNFEYFATVYGICVVDGAPAIVMKQMDTDLFCFLRESENKATTQLMEWRVDRVVAVAKAVEALHDLNIFHRDLKSPNILVKGKMATPLCIAGRS